MLRKETNEVLKQSMLLAPGVLAGTFLTWIGASIAKVDLSFGEMFFPIFQVGLLFMALFMGISLFMSETKNGGMEYLLTLPYTRLRLLWIKLFPRIVALIALFLIYYLALGAVGNNDMLILPVTFLLFSYISLFAIGISFSSFRGNLILSVLLAIVTFFVFLYGEGLVFWIAYMLKSDLMEFTVRLPFSSLGFPWYSLIIALAMLSTLIISYLYAFKTFDLKISRKLIKKFMKVFIPSVLVVMSLSVAGIYMIIDLPNGGMYFLTKGNLVLKDNYYSSMKVYDRDSEREIKYYDLNLFHCVEKDNYIYASSGYKNTRIFHIVRMNTTNLDIDVLYTAEPKAWIFSQISVYKGTLAFIEYFRGESVSNLVLLNLETKKYKKINITSGFNLDHPEIFGAGTLENQNFWAVYSTHRRLGKVVIAKEDGTQYEVKLDSLNVPLYVNGMFILFKAEAIEIGNITETGFQLVKQISFKGRLMLYRSLFNWDMNQPPVKEIFLNSMESGDPWERKKYRLDLQTYDFHEIKDLSNTYGYFKKSIDGTWFYIEVPFVRDSKNPTISIYKMNEGKPMLVKKIDMLYKDGKWDAYSDWVHEFETGLIVKNNGKLHVYRFPDLNEIEFKELE